MTLPGPYNTVGMLAFRVNRRRAVPHGTPNTDGGTPSTASWLDDSHSRIGASSGVTPVSNCPSTHSTTGGCSTSQERVAAAAFTAATSAALASSVDSLGKTPSRPSATSMSGTVDGQSPARTVPALGEATV